MSKNIIIAGQAAEGSGALVGWRGTGPLTRAQIVSALMAAECPESWAPRAKSAEAHAGHAVGRLNHQGLIVRRSKRPRTTPAGLPIQWQARWTVQVAAGDASELGDASAPVVLVAELRDDELHIQADDQYRHHSGQVHQVFRELMDSQIFQAGDVTAWLSSVLVRELGATRFGLGYYVPSGNRAQANRLASSMMARWGCAWICPLLPVATSDELRIGIARGLEEDVQAVAMALVAERDAAKESRRDEITPTVAARLLRSVTEVTERVAAYRLLCGHAVDGAIDALTFLANELGRIADATSQRFALLELADAPAAPAPASAPSPAERAAERALARRRDEVALIKTAMIQATERQENGYRVPTPPPFALDDDPSDANAAAANERFGLLELD